MKIKEKVLKEFKEKIRQTKTFKTIIEEGALKGMKDKGWGGNHTIELFRPMFEHLYFIGAVHGRHIGNKETLAEVMKVIYEEISILKDIHVEVDSQLDILRNDIRNNVESVAVDGKAFSRTSDIDNSIDAKEEKIKKYFKKKIEELEQELEQELKQKLGGGK